MIKAYRSSVQCKCKLRGLLQLPGGGGGGGGALLYNRGYGCASETLKTLTLCISKLQQNFGPFADKVAENVRKYVP